MLAAERQLEINFFQKIFQNMEEIYFESHTLEAGPG
jgi:hypothetical protein